MTPTQEDREAAWPYNDFHCLPDRQMHDRWLAGYYDNLPQGAVIQAFMRHRLAAEERGARMALEAGDRWLQQQYGLSPLCADLDPAEIVKGAE